MMEPPTQEAGKLEPLPTKTMSWVGSQALGPTLASALGSWQDRQSQDGVQHGH